MLGLKGLGCGLVAVNLRGVLSVVAAVRPGLVVKAEVGSEAAFGFAHVRIGLEVI
jgi:hypothetical protein